MLLASIQGLKIRYFAQKLVVQKHMHPTPKTPTPLFGCVETLRSKKD